MHRNLLIADLGPTFAGWAGDLDGKMVCMAPRGIEDDPALQESLREAVRQQGGDCRVCRACLLGLGA